MNAHLLILLFGCGGVGIRYGVDQYFMRQNYGPSLATLLINIVGSFIAAFIFQMAAQKQMFSEDLKTALIVGFCGGFTTFSGFGLQVLQLWNLGKIHGAVAYAILTPILCLTATVGGVFCAKGI